MKTCKAELANWRERERERERRGDNHAISNMRREEGEKNR